jgi:transcriptional regulator with XRE-family HTH domain
MGTIQERLQIIMKTHRLTAASFADEIGVQRSGLSHIMSGRNKPSLDFIQKTLAAFPRVNGDWLLTGRQDFKKNTEEFLNNESNSYKGNITGASKEDEKVTDVNRKTKLIEKVILFYNDGTYDITYPEKKTAGKEV